MVTVHGTPSMGTVVGEGVGDGAGVGLGDTGDGLGAGTGAGPGGGAMLGVGLGSACGAAVIVWLQMATSWMAQGWVESVALRVTLVVPAGMGVQ